MQIEVQDGPHAAWAVVASLLDGVPVHVGRHDFGSEPSNVSRRQLEFVLRDGAVFVTSTGACASFVLPDGVPSRLERGVETCLDKDSYVALGMSFDHIAKCVPVAPAPAAPAELIDLCDSDDDDVEELPAPVALTATSLGVEVPSPSGASSSRASAYANDGTGGTLPPQTRRDYTTDDLDALKRADHHEYLMALAYSVGDPTCSGCGVRRPHGTRCFSEKCVEAAVARWAAHRPRGLYDGFSHGALAGLDYAGYSAGGQGSGLSKQLDLSVPSQSIRGQTLDTIEGASAQINGEAGFVACANYCFRTMIEREQELHREWVSFYHSYNYAALLYEVQAEVARALFDLPDDSAPLMRLLKAPFRKRPTLAVLRADFASMAGQDHSPEFRALAICASLSLFGANTEAPPLSCFSVGYGGGDPPNYRTMLRSLLSTLMSQSSSSEDASIEGLVDTLVEIGRRYHLPVMPYERQSSRHHDQHARSSTLTGHMLQIFIRRSRAAELAYPSLPMGVPDGAGLLPAVDTRTPMSGQARVFVHPDEYLHGKDTKVFHYCARPELCSSIVDGGGLTRGALISELRKALAPVFGDASKQARALKAVGRAPGVRIVGGNIVRSDDHLAGKRPRQALEPAREAEQAADQDEDRRIQDVLRLSVFDR